MESGLYLRTKTTGVFWIPPEDLAQQDKWVIRTTFRVVPSIGETSSEDRMAEVRLPSRSYPVFPTAISP